MKQQKKMLKREASHLPDEFLVAHELCFINHDVLVEMLKSGTRENIFSKKQTFTFRDEADKLAYEKAANVVAWLGESGRHKERAHVLRTAVFPRLLSDFLHYVYEALRCSRRANLSVAYSLLRKPLRDHLALLELIVAELDGFAQLLVDNPAQLDAGNAGGVAAHAKRIAAVLDKLGEKYRFDAAYLAQLRFDKSSHDSFAGMCDKALHLFTDNKHIKTEKMNVNFIFSGPDEWRSQWMYLYTRLPYVLMYARLLFEHVSTEFSLTSPSYLADIERRIAARVALWADTVEEDYWTPELARFAAETIKGLMEECERAGYPLEDESQLERMQSFGTFLGESKKAAARRRDKERELEYAALIKIEKKLQGED